MAFLFLDSYPLPKASKLRTDLCVQDHEAPFTKFPAAELRHANLRVSRMYFTDPLRKADTSHLQLFINGHLVDDSATASIYFPFTTLTI